ncbi:MAG: Rho termination factor N-terminal domain-containing protein, partial [Yaniella sp.]|nr:Rho termination factor N-terminal domain-containing protein [Yaniella sp.]
MQITQQLVILTVAVEFVIKFAGIYARTDEGEGTFVTEQDTLQTPTDNGSAGLGGLKIAQLQTLASQLGITGTSRMRKAQLVEVIADHQRGGSDTARQAVEEAKAAAAKERKSRGNAAKTKDAEQPAEQASAKEAP